VRDPHSQWLPSSPINFTYEGVEYPLLIVPTEDGERELALVKPGREQSDYVDPQNPEAGIFTVEGRWRTFEPVYSFDASWNNFPTAWEQVNLGRLFRNTIIIAVLGTIGTLLSSILVAYGFARFKVP